MSVTSRKRLLAKLKNKAYRDAYTAEHVKTTTPLQIRTVREQREWTQGQLAEKAKTTQTAISRTEDPNYGNLTLNNLLKIAAAFDVGLLVKLVPFSRLVQEYEDVSPEAMAASSFMDELSILEAWAHDVNEPSSTVPAYLKPTLTVIYRSVRSQQEDRRLLSLPALGEPFAMNFPQPNPVVIQRDTRDTSVLQPELREAS